MTTQPRARRSRTIESRPSPPAQTVKRKKADDHSAKRKKADHPARNNERGDQPTRLQCPASENVSRIV
jgi:hypothetical protein